MKKTHSRSNLIGFCRELMRLLHRNTSIFIVLFLLSLAFLTTIFGLYLLQASYVLGVQITVSKYSRQCEAIHVASVVGGQANTRHYVTLVKSILAKTQNPIHFHVLIDRESYGVLKKLFETWELPAGVNGLLKLIIPEILPPPVNKVIVLDTDLLFVSDIVELWSHFSFTAPQEFLGMTENLSGWYSQNVTGPKWPALGNGFNSGLILMNLDRLRDARFSTRWREVAEDTLRFTGKTFLADQDILNAYLFKYPNILYFLPPEWNVQVGMKSILPDNLLQRAKLLHVNNKNKTLGSHPKVETIRKELQDLDGSVFLQTRHTCSQKAHHSFAIKEKCDVFKPRDSYRTNLYLLPYYHQNTDTITLVTQISADRLSLLDSLLQSWNGTVSVALYGTDRDINNVVSFLHAKFSRRQNIGLHGVYKTDNVYPINYLRNVALNSSNTEFLFLIDGDFVVNQEAEVRRRIRDLPEKSVYVIPAFEYKKAQYDVLELLNKTSLLKYVEQGDVFPFRSNIWSSGHKATNFLKWYNQSEPYQVDWEPNFEPYIVAKKSELPFFDQRFGGFGWNKATYAFELRTMGYVIAVFNNKLSDFNLWFIQQHLLYIDIIHLRTS